jgi:hypothetical protein
MEPDRGASRLRLHRRFSKRADHLEDSTAFGGLRVMVVHVERALPAIGEAVQALLSLSSDKVQ